MEEIIVAAQMILYYICMEEGTLLNNNPNPVAPSQNTPPANIDSQNFISQNNSPQNPAVQNANIGSMPPIPPDHGEGFFSRINRKVILIIFLIFGLIFISISAFLLLKSGKEEQIVKKTITYWGFEDQVVMDQIIAEYEKNNSNINIEYIEQDLENYREKLNTRIINGTGPDMFSFHNTWIPMIGNQISPLPESVISKSEFSNRYSESISRDLLIENRINGIPLYVDTLIMYVNKDLLNKNASQSAEVLPPLIWQEFINVTKDLTQRDENGRISISGAGIGTYDNVRFAPEIVSLLFLQNNVDLEERESSTQKIIDAIKFYTNFSLVENNVWDSTLDNSDLAFRNGKSVIYFGYVKDYAQIKKANPSLNFEAYPVPQLTTNKSINLLSYFAEGVSAESKNKDESYKFFKYLFSSEVIQKINESNEINNFSRGLPADKVSLNSVDGYFSRIKTQPESSLTLPFISETKDNGLNDKGNLLIKNLIDSNINGSISETSVENFFIGLDELNASFSGPASN